VKLEAGFEGPVPAEKEIARNWGGQQNSPPDESVPGGDSGIQSRPNGSEGRVYKSKEVSDTSAACKLGGDMLGVHVHGRSITELGLLSRSLRGQLESTHTQDKTRISVGLEVLDGRPTAGKNFGRPR